MNDTTTTNGRSRRRASREAGSPADAPAAEAVVVISKADAGPTPAPAAVKMDAAPAAASPAAEAVEADAAETVQAEAAETAAETVKPDAPAAETVKVDPSAVAEAETVKAATVSDADEDATVVVSVPEPEVAAAPAAPTPPERVRKPRRGLHWGEIAAIVVIVLSVVGLIASGTWYAKMRHDDQAETATDQTYVQTARQAVLNLTNISDDNAQADIDRVLAIASGQLKAEYQERRDAYSQVVQQAKVKATGQVIEAALENKDATSARVLVAATQTLTNAGDPNPQQRTYRFRVTVNRGDTGVTASAVEFVA